MTSEKGRKNLAGFSRLAFEVEDHLKATSEDAMMVRQSLASRGIQAPQSFESAAREVGLALVSISRAITLAYANLDDSGEHTSHAANDAINASLERFKAAGNRYVAAKRQCLQFI